MNIAQINSLTQQEIQAEMQAAAKEERNYFIFKHKLAGGEIREVEVYSYPVIYREKDCLFSVIHDITGKITITEHNNEISLAVYITGGTAIGGLFVFVIIIYQKNKKLKRAKEEIENFRNNFV